MIRAVSGLTLVVCVLGSTSTVEAQAPLTDPYEIYNRHLDAVGGFDRGWGEGFCCGHCVRAPFPLVGYDPGWAIGCAPVRRCAIDSLHDQLSERATS